MVLRVSANDRLRLEAVIADPNSRQKHVWRAWIVLLTGSGRGAQEIMWSTGETMDGISRWQRRFIEAGIDGLLADEARPPPAPAVRVEPTRTNPTGAIEHWADLAATKVAGVSLGIIQRIWNAHGFQPDGARQLLGDPQAAASVYDIVDLYLHPPADAVVLSVDEKSQIPVTGRTWQDASLEDDVRDPGARDQERHPTTTLFCALDVHSGRIIGRCMQRQRRQEFTRFLNAIEREIPPGKAVHAILDNYGPHRHSAALRWLERHPRFAFHFTPAGMSWINLVEIFFGRLTRECLRRHAVSCIIDLQIVINGYVARTNTAPRPYVDALIPVAPSVNV